MLLKQLSQRRFNTQLMFVVTASILGLAVFTSAINTWKAHSLMNAYSVEQGIRVTETLSKQAAIGLLYSSADSASEVAVSTLTFPDVIAVKIVDVNGRTLFEKHKGDSAPGHVKNQIPATHIAVAGLIDQTQNVWTFGAPVVGGIADASPFDVTPRPNHHLGYVYIKITKSSLTELTRNLILNNIVIVAGITLILLYAIRKVTSRMMVPLRALSLLMRRAESGESGLRAKPSGPRDLIEMSLAFNKMMNVLEQREAELLDSRDAAVNLAKVKSMFASTVSHEIRTPLNGVIGMLDIVKQSKLSDRQSECIEIAWTSAMTLIELVNNILDYSKMEASKLTIDQNEFNIRKLVEEVVNQAAYTAQSNGVEIGCVVNADVPTWVITDQLRVKQVLLNLVSNAVKFTPSGRISVFVRRKSDAELECEVRDTGIGMPASSLDNLFGAYVQADPSANRKYGGTGLGLAICKELVTLLGGEISVFSDLDYGSRFLFTMAISLPGSETKSANEAKQALEGLKVLAYDLSPITIQFFDQEFIRCGAEVGSVALSDFLGITEQLQAAVASGRPFDILVATFDAYLENIVRTAIQTHSPTTKLLKIASVRLDDEASSNRTPIVYKPLCGELVTTTIRRLASGIDQVEADPKVTRKSISCDDHQKGSTSILIVEDNYVNQMVAAGIIKSLGLDCAFASNGEEALSAATSHHFDLILMDCNMPGIDGFEATRMIRAQERLEKRDKTAVIVAITASAQKDDEEACLESGMDDYLAKPITISRIREKIQTWLNVDLPSQPELVLSDEEHLTPQGTNGVIDLWKLREVQANIGARISDVVRHFCMEGESQIKSIECDWRDVRLHRAVMVSAHTLKGAAANLGAKRVASIAESIERLAVEKNLNGVEDLIPPLWVEFKSAVLELSNEVKWMDFNVPKQTYRSKEAKARVLLVDDDVTSRTALKYTFEAKGYEVDVAKDGLDGFKKASKNLPDIVIMDAIMPMMDGFTACERIKAIAPQVPVIILSGLDDEASVSRSARVGAARYLLKTTSGQEIINIAQDTIATLKQS